MKRILYIIGIMIVTAFGCTEIDFEINEVYEQAEITGVELYDRGMKRADKTTEIFPEEGAILVVLKPRKDITDLKIAVTASTGVSTNPSMSVGYQDFSNPKTYEVTSPNKSIKKNWTITVQNPE